MLAAVVLAGEGMQGVGDVPGGIDSGRGGPQRGVRQDAVLKCDARRFCQRHLGDHSHSDDHKVRGQDLPGIRDHAGDPARLPPDPGGRGGEPEPDAVRLVQRTEKSAQLGPDCCAQRHLLQPQQGDGVSIGARSRGQLHPDPARTDHHHVPAAVGQARAQTKAVVHGAEGADPLQIAARQRDAPGTCPGGQQQRGIAQPLAVPEGHAAGGRINPRDGGAQPQVDPVLRVPAGRNHGQGVVAGLGQQVFLGQRRAQVGMVPLLRQQDHRPAMAFRAEGLGGGGAGEAAAHDHEVPGGHDVLDSCGRRHKRGRMSRENPSKTVIFDFRSAASGRQGLFGLGFGVAIDWCVRHCVTPRPAAAGAGTYPEPQRKSVCEFLQP